jgi:hypothetical protein
MLKYAFAKSNLSPLIDDSSVIRLDSFLGGVYGYHDDSSVIRFDSFLGMGIMTKVRAIYSLEHSFRSPSNINLATLF